MKFKQFNFKKVNSTNDVAIRIIKNTNYKYGIITSEKQKKGRGRYGKKWISYKGNLFVSIFFSLEKIKISLKKLTNVNCFLIKKLISSYYKKHVKIKPPNDILIDKKKICGILQVTLKKSNVTFIIVGIGINLIKSPNIKNYPTTNLFELTNSKINKNKIISDLNIIYKNFVKKLSKQTLKKINLN